MYKESLHMTEVSYQHDKDGCNSQVRLSVLAATAHVVMQCETADLVVQRSLRHLSQAKMGAAPTPALVCP